MNLATYELSDNDYLKSIWVALTRLEALLGTPAPLAPVPNIVVSPPDLSEIVTAVTGLRPSVTAEEIAQVLGDLLQIPAPQNTTQGFQEIADALKKLDFRLKGMGTQAYGGGALTLEPGQTLATTLPPAVVDAQNTTTTPLAAGATFTGSATNILPYMQVNLMLYGTPSTAQASLFLEFSPDGTNWDISIPILVSDPTYFIPYPLINVGKFYRCRYINDGGAAFYTAVGSSTTPATPTLMTVFRMSTLLYTRPSKELARTLGQTINDSQPVGLMRSVSTAKNPNGSYVNIPASGTVSANSTTTNLAGGAAFTGTFVSTSGFTTINILINSSHDAATNGVTFQFSNDGSSIDRSVSYDYTTASGGIFFTLPTEAEYFRLLYTNGATLTTSLHIETIFQISASAQVSAPLSARVLRSQNATMVRNDPIALVTPRASQETIGTVSAQLTCSSSPLSKRKSLTLKSDANNTNNNIIYISFVSPATTGNGFGLSNGDAIDLELGDQDDTGANVGIYCVATNSGQKLHVIEMS